jgi:hypothetical protein
MKQVPDARITNADTNCQRITESTRFVNRIRQIFRSAQVRATSHPTGANVTRGRSGTLPHSGLHISEKWSKNTPGGP